MPAIGITGGISTGKSTFTKFLRELLAATPQRGASAVTFFDADEAARRAVDLPETAGAIRAQFGDEVFSEAGELNRAALRAIVFADADKRRALEQILHPPIRREWSALAEKHRNSSDFFFADIPLLYETGGETLCDRVVVVACSREVQLRRLQERRGISEDAAARIIDSQMPIEEKIRRADHVVWNNGPIEMLHEQTKQLVDLWRTEKWTKA